MAKRGRSNRFKYKVEHGGERISDAKVQESEIILARLVALAFASDNPHLFGALTQPSGTPQVPSGSCQVGIIPVHLDGIAVTGRASE
jgi:hypothetical protein